MQELLMQMLEKAKTDKRAFKMIKHTAVRCQLFELAANLREIERELFPESDEIKKAKERAKMLQTLFRMVNLDISEKASWLIGETIEHHRKLKSGLSIEDAMKLKVKSNDLFDGEE